MGAIMMAVDYFISCPFYPPPGPGGPHPLLGTEKFMGEEVHTATSGNLRLLEQFRIGGRWAEVTDGSSDCT